MAGFYQYYHEANQWQPSVQDVELQRLLEQVRQTVPFYRTLAPQTNDLSCWPFLTKTLIRENYRALRADDAAGRRLVENFSGGSTGAPITVLQDPEFYTWSVVAEEFFYRQLLGVNLMAGCKVVLWGSERETYGQRERWRLRARHWLSQTVFLNSYRMTAAQLELYASVLADRRPILVRGYAGSVFELARYLHRTGRRVPRPRAVCTSAETLLPFMRQLIREVFDCPVHDFYGSREVGPVAGECRRGKLHVFAFHNHVEVLGRDNQPVAPGLEGRVVVTTLRNRSMPLIRYEIGDLAVPAAGCDCGSRLPAWERIAGRVTDRFVTPNGDLVDGRFFTTFFFHKPWAAEFQVLQEAPDQLKILYVPVVPPTEAEQADVNGKISQIMGPACRVRWQAVREIPLTPHGKRLYTRSLVTSPDPAQTS